MMLPVTVCVRDEGSSDIKGMMEIFLASENALVRYGDVVVEDANLLKFSLADWAVENIELLRSRREFNDTPIHRNLVTIELSWPIPDHSGGRFDGWPVGIFGIRGLKGFNDGPQEWP